LVSKKDLDFLSREFETLEIPKEKKYLLKYFRKDVQQAFLKYFFIFGSFDNFVDHTGLYCQPRWLKILHQKLIDLESIHSSAKQNMDLELLAKIESGKFKFKD
jgi:hypothetical protein